MKCLITGGAGFIGSNLALELKKQGNNVTVLDNFLKGNMKNLEGFKGEVVEGDESKIPDEEFDVVFHLAAITDTTVTDKQEMYDNNVNGFRLILEFCKKKNCKLVYASSGATYGDGPVPMKEDQALNPLNVYGESKVEMDKMAKQGFFGKTLVGLRFFNVFGPREHFKGKMSSMIYQLALQMKKGKNPRIFKHGEQERDHIYVKDVVTAVIKAASYDEFGIFNVATGTKTSFNQLIDFLNISLKMDLKPEYFNNPFVGAYQDTTVADMTKAEKELGFKAEYSVLDGVKDYIEWLNETGWYE